MRLSDTEKTIHCTVLDSQAILLYSRGWIRNLQRPIRMVLKRSASSGNLWPGTGRSALAHAGLPAKTDDGTRSLMKASKSILAMGMICKASSTDLFRVRDEGARQR